MTLGGAYLREERRQDKCWTITDKATLLLGFQLWASDQLRYDDRDQIEFRPHVHEHSLHYCKCTTLK